MDKAHVSALALLLAALPAGAEAQSEGWDWALRELSVAVEVGRPSDAIRGAAQVRYVEPERVAVPRRAADRRDDRYRGDAPPFCRNGAGHPVHGRRWCVEKGYGIARVTTFGVRWERHDWHGVVFARVAYRARTARLDAWELREAVGRSTWARLERERRRLGGRYELTGRWLRPRAGVLVLQVRSGPLAVAELTDLNGDGRVDVVLLASR